MLRYEFDPAAEVALNADGTLKLQLVEARRLSSGRLSAKVHVLNGHRKFTDWIDLDARAERAHYVRGALAAEPALEAATTDAGLIALAGKMDARIKEAQQSAPSGAGEAPQQLSLSPPGCICVARDDEGRPAYVLLGNDGALKVVHSVDAPYKGAPARHVPPPDLPWLLPSAAAVQQHWARARIEPGWAADLLRTLEAYHHKASDLVLSQAAKFDLARTLADLIRPQSAWFADRAARDWQSQAVAIKLTRLRQH